MVPKGEQWEQASAYWATLHSDDDAVFDLEVVLDASEIGPQVTWGTSPEMVTSIDGHVPRASDLKDESARKSLARALEANRKLTRFVQDYRAVPAVDPTRGYPTGL